MVLEVQKKKNIKYKLNEVLFILILNLFILFSLFAIYLYNEKIFEQLISSSLICLVILAIFAVTLFYFCSPHCARSFVYRYICRKTEELIGNESEYKYKDDSWQKDLLVTAPVNETAVKEEIKNDNKGNEYKQLLSDIEAGKHEKVIVDITKKLKLVKKPSAEEKLRLLLEVAYSEAANDSTFTDRILNLERLLAVKGTLPLEIRYKLSYNLAVYYFVNKQLDQCRILVPEIISQLSKDEISDTCLLSNLYNLQASIYLVEDKSIQAISYYKSAIKYSSNDAEYLYNIAAIYFFDLFNPKLALDYCRASFSHLNENSQNTFFKNLVYVYYRSAAYEKEFEEAYSLIENYHLNESSQDFKQDEAYIQFKRKNYKEAERIAKEVIEKQPKNDTALNVMGMINLVRKEYNIALNYFNAVLPGFEEEKYIYTKYYLSEIYYCRAICNLNLSNIEQAQRDMDRAETLGYDEIEADVISQLLLANKKALIMPDDILSSQNDIKLLECNLSSKKSN